MKDLVADIKYDASKVINQAVGPSKEFCMGYMNPGAGEGYISTMKLSVGTVDVKDLDTVTENIVSYDRCEKNDAYIGQINLFHREWQPCFTQNDMRRERTCSGCVIQFHGSGLSIEWTFFKLNMLAPVSQVS